MAEPTEGDYELAEVALMTASVTGGLTREAVASVVARARAESEDRTAAKIVAWMRECVRRAGALDARERDRRPGEVVDPLNFQKDAVIITRACADAIERGEWKK